MIREPSRQTHAKKKYTEKTCKHRGLYEDTYIPIHIQKKNTNIQAEQKHTQSHESTAEVWDKQEIKSKDRDKKTHESINKNTAS